MSPCATPAASSVMSSGSSRSVAYFASAVVAASLLGALVFAVTARRPSAPAPGPTAVAPSPAASRTGPTTAAPQAAVPVPAAASSRAPPARPRAPRAYRIAAIGDSLTDRKSHGGMYLDYLEKRCPQSHVDNYGRGGDMVNQMRRRFARVALSTRPGSAKPRYTHLIVFGGVNDLYSDLTAGRTPKKVAEDLLHIYTRAHEHDTQVVALTVAPWGGFRKYYNARRGQATLELNRWIRDQFDAGTVDYVVDAYALLSCGQPEKLCPEYAKPFRDGIHFGPGGHEVLGKALYQRVFRDCL
jgi:lysophospholipase L1-like esterase